MAALGAGHELSELLSMLGSHESPDPFAHYLVLANASTGSAIEQPSNQHLYARGPPAGVAAAAAAAGSGRAWARPSYGSSSGALATPMALELAQWQLQQALQQRGGGAVDAGGALLVPVMHPLATHRPPSRGPSDLFRCDRGKGGGVAPPASKQQGKGVGCAYVPSRA